MTGRFPEMWLVQGTVDCSMDTAVDQVARLFINALGLSDQRTGNLPEPRVSSERL